MEWEDVPEVIDDWLLKVAAPAWDIRQRTSRVLASTDIGYYYHPGLEKAAVYAPLASPGDCARTKAAAERAVGKSNVRGLFLSYQELSDPHTGWVKVAYAPTLRRLGEYLNFFPGQYPGNMPNHPSPLAAMLTSGLLGAGLGWGAGTLLGKMLPEGYGRNLGRTGLILGGGLGSAPGLLWGLTNKFGLGRTFNDPRLLRNEAGAEPIDYPRYSSGANTAPPLGVSEGHSRLGPDIAEVAENISHGYKHAADQMLKGVELGKRYAEACKLAAYAYGPRSWNDNGGTFGQMPVEDEPTPLDVNINALGQTLYNQGASPNLAATTMSAMYAAQQLPDPRASPGWATYGQLGQLAQNAAGDYARGVLAGAAINTAIGTPLAASTFGLANAGLGIIGAVVPKLFGR